MNIWPDVSAPNNQLRWLFIDMNSYFASCEQQQNPELRGKPVAIVPVMTDSTCAIAASYEAKALGIKTGTPVWKAKQICPTIKLVQARHKLYVKYHHKIAEVVETCVPIEDVASIDEFACRLDKVQCEPENAKALALEIKEAIREGVGDFVKCSIGIAANKLLAKLGSDMQKPNGLTILKPSDMPQAILHLKPQAISGIGDSMVERLAKAGIHDMAALWATDAQRLRRIWGGIGGLRFHELLHGADLSNPFVNPTRSMSHQHVLAPEDRTKEKSELVMRQLLVRVAQRLRDEGFYARRMLIAIKWSNDLGYYGDETSFKETQDTGYLLPILVDLWKKVPAFKPLRICVTLADLRPKTAHQPDLFDRPKPANLTKALDEINDRYGRGTVDYGSVAAPITSKIAFSRVPKLGEL